ncbi:MAG: FAD-dependent oxidoreductase [Acetobacteraceae bacterium]
MIGAGSYDYIIVGAGSAGCVLAHRLTEDEGATVLLLEAGGSDRHPYIQIPLGLGKLQQRKMFDWGYTTEPEPHLNNRRLTLLRGKVLGGSGSINVMAYTHGHRADFDRWARDDATGWSFADVLPYFKKGESWEKGESTWRGGSGPLGTEGTRDLDPLFDAWREAAMLAQWPMSDDPNGSEPIGFSASEWTIKDGRRASGATAYLKPVLGRSGLTLRTHAYATKVTINGSRATGVEFVTRGEALHAEASREVILCGGVFNSPQLLMLSGIGPANHLRQHSITPLVDLAVGQNLQDHLQVRIRWARVSPSPFQRLMRADRAATAMVRAWLFGTGPATMLPNGLKAFLKTKPELDAPDLEFLFLAASLAAGIWFPGVTPPFQDMITANPVLLHPRSCGEVTLRSADPTQLVRVANNFLSDPADIATLREGYRIAQDLAYRRPMEAFRGERLSPSTELTTDSEIDEWIRQEVITVNHPLGTCSMGRSTDSVLDPDLKVRGVEGLRVVDAAALPDMPSGHINAIVMMLAERASDLIRGRQLLAQSNA